MLHVVYFDQRTYACACVRMVENDEKRWQQTFFFVFLNEPLVCMMKKRMRVRSGRNTQQLRDCVSYLWFSLAARSVILQVAILFSLTAGSRILLQVLGTRLLSRTFHFSGTKSKNCLVFLLFELFRRNFNFKVS